MKTWCPRCELKTGIQVEDDLFICSQDGHEFSLGSTARCPYCLRSDKLVDHDGHIMLCSRCKKYFNPDEISQIIAITHNQEITLIAKDQRSVGMEGHQMAESVVVSNPWNAAVSGNFVQLGDGEPKTIVITGWELKEVEKTWEGKTQLKWEFQSKCVEEDGVPVEKLFNITSKVLLAKLRPVFEQKDPTKKVKIQIVKVGQGQTAQYSVKEVGVSA